MLYSVLIYNSEEVAGALSKKEMDALIADHEQVRRELAAEGKLGPVARLMPTTAATTLRATGGAPLILDGPCAGTEEQLLGFYILRCESLEEAHDAAQRIGRACHARSLEVRPIALFHPGELE
jgi:hypothetical protein